MANYICQNRYGTFYFRFIIPLAYRKHFKNKREIRYSLKTDSKRLAVIRARLYRVRVDNILEQLESMAKDETITTELMHFFSMVDGNEITADGEGDEAKELRLFKAARRDDAEFAKELGIDPTKQVTKQATANNHTTETWESFSARYLRVVLGKRRKLQQDSLDGYKATYSLVPFILGKNRNLQSFTNGDMEELYDGLCILPIRFRSPTSQYKDMSFEDIKLLDLPRAKLRSIKTVTQDFGKIRTLFAKACKDNVIDRNVADSVEYERDQTPDKERRLPFDDVDLSKIFTHPHFTENKWRKIAKTRTQEPYTFWLFPLALFTGARMNELLQLEKKNIVQFDGGWYLDIKNEFDPETGKKTKSVKNKNSIRFIPIADKLIEIGFLSFVNTRKTDALFPEVSKIKTGKKAVTKKLNYLLGKMDVHVGGKKTFHSLRHSFINQALAKNTEVQYLAGVTGHLNKEEKNISAVLKNVYFKGYPVDILKTEVIDKLDFDVDFSGVQWP
ncbi:MAG: tyrosine-type recombinase/integrase [Methylophaga sp.]|nr:tyrosine-type recombinase/integrase [Methylophaga sp.]